MTEMELKLTGGRIVSAKLKKGVLKILVEEVKEEQKVIPEVLKPKDVCEDVNCDQFILVPASTLSLTDDFMRHSPKTDKEKDFKELLTKVIKSRICDFYRPRFDPSFDPSIERIFDKKTNTFVNEGKICYQPGLRPAVGGAGMNYYWWEKNAKEFCPKRKSRLGTKSEYVAFLGVLLKKLVESGWSIADAWNAVCNDSNKLGHYFNSKGAQNDFEPSGSRGICGYFDLANTRKVLAEDEDEGGCWFASGYFGQASTDNSLATLRHVSYRDYINYITVGWLVLS